MHITPTLAAPCPYAHNKAEAVRNALRAAIRGQNDAIQNITDAVAAWEDE
jgi:hypothetical protein